MRFSVGITIIVIAAISTFISGMEVFDWYRMSWHYEGIGDDKAELVANYVWLACSIAAMVSGYTIYCLERLMRAAEKMANYMRKDTAE